MNRDESARATTLLEDACVLAASPIGDLETSRRFLHALYHNAPPNALLDHNAQAIADTAVSLWRFAARREPGKPALRLVTTPETPSARVIEIVNDDMRFLVNSTTEALAGLGLVVELVLHPVLAVHRDAHGNLLEIGTLADRSTIAHESMMHILLQSPVPPERETTVLATLATTLADVRAVVADWPEMREQVRTLSAEIRHTPHLSQHAETAEDAAFLDWLDDDNFIFLGTRRYTLDGAELEVTPNAGRGLLRHDDYLVFDGLRALARASPDVQAFLQSPLPTMISKSTRRSPIHRPALMDTIIVKEFDTTSRVIGLRVVLGLFTINSMSRLPHEIPLLRRKVASCQARSGFTADSRDGRALQHILDTFPRDELFQIDEAQLFETAIGVLHLKQRPGLALFVMRDPFKRFSTALVYMPRDRYDAEIGRRIAGHLAQAFDGTIAHESTHFEDAVLARLHYVIATPGEADVSIPEIERRLTEALRSWGDRLSEALIQAHGTDHAQVQLRRYAQAFPPAYRDRFDAATAIADMKLIDALTDEADLAVALSSPSQPDLRLRIAHRGTPLALSDVLPVLENLGVRVENENPFELAPRDLGTIWVQELELTSRLDAIGEDAATRFETAFTQVWSGTVENDGFNRLVLAAGLTARAATILRTYCKLLRQAGSLFSQAYMEDTLAAHAQIAALLVRLFEARSDLTSTTVERNAQDTELNHHIAEALDHVDNLDEDRILRGFLLLIRKTLRTNYRQRDTNDQPLPYLSVKIASREIDLLPQPRPLVEIFVASPRMEGIHLRGGKVARGGIRWSDRREDFRTEVLGLMKAQMVKNAVIVPVGSKGGFVLKRPPTTGGREAHQAEGIACYRILMQALLELTDNIEGNVVVPPQNVVCHDIPDTYLVVAADKGTATFSDIANGVAIDHGFWLGDAFASGGSVGYDHKVMGITAKGAWEAVKRHFRELGRDIQTTDFTCVGVGDMSGDVFGNAMLLSRQTRLIAAFNHMHVFLDPTPDPAAAWAERARLFKLPRSGWNDYDTTLISKGGGVFDRKAKSIALTPEIRACFNLTQEHIAPSELIQALLRHDADLLWFGGIGTYVKASTETQSDAGDRANDSLRVNAAGLRAKVVGEGANLAVTQRARVEYALAGGRINTDAIDNSAGVDTSDHEVNIKIATGDMIAAHHIQAADRTAFLAAMTNDVEHLVLVDNILQTQALSLAEAHAPALLDSHAGLMRAMERRGRLDRAVEFLPDDDTIVQRAKLLRGLTRPELAVLLAYSKMTLYDDLLASDLPDIAALHSELLAYFPKALRQLSVLAGHRLHREIIATCVANSLVNRMGPSFVEDTQTRTGRNAADIARGFLIVRDVFALPPIWQAIEALDNQVPAAIQTRLHLAVAAIVDQAVRWFLQSGLQLDPAACVETFKPGVETLATHLATLLPDREATVNASREATHFEAGVPPELAHQIVMLNTLSTAMDIVQIAGRANADILEVGAVYFASGADTGLLTLRRQARALPTSTHWQRLAADALTDDSYVQQRDITARLIATKRQSALPEPGSALHEVLAEIARTTPPDLAMLTVAARRIRTSITTS